MSVTSTYGVVGMTCDHCVSAVTQELTKLPGVSQVNIDLVADGTSTVRVLSEAELSTAEVRDAVDEAGYELASNPA